ncbi:cardiolipin synthase [Fusobacterium sp. PH5-44]|uniref:cardiolipin synthase n=1 Tax=unclassified Fusobacterium TaxID=2648384 RepID=UPI003D1F5D1B
MSLIIYFFKEYIFYINIIFVLVIILIEKRNPLYTLFWITILLLTPYVGFVLYLFLGLKFRKRRVSEKFYKWKFSRSREIINTSERPDLFKWKQLISYLEVSSMNKLTSLNSLRLFTDGNKFFDKIKEDLKNAKESINVEYYIFKYDGLGQDIVDILVDKAKEGVDVKVIIDGASAVNKKIIKRITAAGGSVKRFFPWHFLFLRIASLRVNYRDHRKLTIIDDKFAYIGGFNIGDEYLGKGKLGNWRDTGIRVFGEAVLELKKEFYFSWGIVNKRDFVIEDSKYAYETEVIENLIADKGQHGAYVQVVSSGPNYQFRTMRDNFLKIILEAQKYIYIQSPYFVPDESLLEALKVAATSGITIKIMIPAVNDHVFMKWVNQYFAGELLEFGVEIYQYDKGFLHSKFIIADDEIASVGTANFDYRSFYQNFEVNINIYQKEIVSSLREEFHNDMKHSKRLYTSQYAKRSIWVKFKESIFRLLAPIL